MSNKALMTGVVDRRQQKTRAALHSAFVDLLLDQGYEALTIGAVTEAANVGRSTFYEHYRTKDDLLRASMNGPFVLLAKLVNEKQSPQSLGDLLWHFRRNQQVARVLLSWPTRPVLSSALAEHILVCLLGTPKLQSQPLVPVEVIARQIADMQLALVEAWVSGRPAFGVEAAADALNSATGALVKSLYR
jgi:AcrR family transcriptional regulator